MSPSFARLRKTLLVTVLASTLAACASLPPPTAELATAEQAVSRATAADADQYAPDLIAIARRSLASAQAAMAVDREDDARRLALQAAADADFAHASSEAAAARAAYRQRAGQVADLQRRLRLDDLEPAPLPAEPTPLVGQYASRLQALAADPRLSGLAAFERLRAQQAIDALVEAGKRERAQAEQLAERRVRTAEVAAWAQAVRRDADRLEADYRELQLEATRREATAARAEAERLRFEAQLRAEEAERLRRQALAEEQARQQAEQALAGAATEQAARVNAAREQAMALAREEAELVGGAPLPASTRAPGGETFVLAGNAFPSGSAVLTTEAAASLRSLGAYAGLAQVPTIRVVGHTDSQGDAAANQALSQKRAEAVREALSKAGVPRARIEAVGRGAAEPVADNTTAAGRAKNRRVEVVLVQK